MLKYFYWKGRTSRFTYFITQFMIFICIAGIVLTTLPLIYESHYTTAYVRAMANVQFYTNIFSFFVFYWDLCAKTKRFHDLDMSPWNLLWLIVPIVDFYFFYLLFFKKGTRGANRYGPDPLSATRYPFKESA